MKRLVLLLVICLIASPVFAIQIEDGTGEGNKAAVESDNRLLTLATTHSEAAHSSENGNCYFYADSYEVTAADTVLWLTNTSTTTNFLIEKIHIASDGGTSFVVHSPTYVSPDPAGTTITGTNANRTTGKVADTVCVRDEVSNSQANILIEGICAASADVVFPVDGKIILGYHDTIAVDFTSGTLGAVTFVGFFE